jgi:MOSC domain-containing protein YiiM
MEHEIVQLVSVNVGMPREVVGPDRVTTSGIFKSPVTGACACARSTSMVMASDPTVHGGPDKAVYAYPIEHYDFWRVELPQTSLEWGAFGENLDTRGLLETDICIGDELRIGNARVRVTQPRLPCFKLGIRLQRPDILHRFQASLRTGFYLRVLEEGESAPATRSRSRIETRTGSASRPRRVLYLHDDGDHATLRSADRRRRPAGKLARAVPPPSTSRRAERPRHAGTSELDRRATGAEDLDRHRLPGAEASAWNSWRQRTG